MIAARRLPGLVYAHRHAAYVTGMIFSTLVYSLFKWNVFCVNLQAWQHVKKMCALYEHGLAVGSLCAPLCVTEDIRSLTCHSFRASKEAVFGAEWHDVKLVFKSVDTGAARPLRWRDNGALKYPTEKEFLHAVRAIVKRKLNLTLAYDTASRLARLKPSYEEKDAGKRRKEMDSLWYLLQDNEYLLTALFTDKDVFAQLLGTCGPYYAVEYLEPVPFVSAAFSITENWGRRLKLALQILELLDELDTSFREPFHMCDVKLDHFGYAGGNARKLKFLDLDAAFPRTVLGTLLETSECASHDDCELLDCRATCNATARRCARDVANDNLQIVCEKIFLGWRMSGTVLVPGLLVSERTPAGLASILRQCADPAGAGGKARRRVDEEVRKRLYNVLYEVERSVNSDFFL